MKKSTKTATISTAAAKPAPTTNYYFNMAHKVYFGNDEKYTIYRDMDRHLYSDVEAEVARLNKAGGFVMPVDDDYGDGEEE